MADVYRFPTALREVPRVTTAHTGPPQQGNAFGFEPIDCTEPPPRFDIRGWAGGWDVLEHGELIARFHGPQFERASKLLRLLREDAERGPPPFQPAA